jgi:hypothetical protein
LGSWLLALGSFRPGGIASKSRDAKLPEELQVLGELIA